MSKDDETRWDDRYASGDYQPRAESSPIVDRAISHIEPGRALVLACGTGRNALRLAEAGFEVEAVDVSGVAIDIARKKAEGRKADVAWRVADLDEFELPPETYHLITMIRYVNRAMWPQIVVALRPNGWLLMEQHLETHLDVIGPSGDFRLAPGELLDAFSDLRFIEYSELVEPSDRSDGLVATVRMLACKGNPGW